MAKSKSPLPTNRQVAGFFQKTGAQDTLDPALSPLAAYLELNAISMNTFSKTSGCALQTVHHWVHGQVPSLVHCYEIERITKGAIPMEAWLACGNAKATLALVRGHQPKEVQAMKASESHLESKIPRSLGPTAGTTPSAKKLTIKDVE